MNTEENNESRNEEFDIDSNFEKYLIKKGAIHKHLLMTRILIDKINNLGYNIELTKKGISNSLDIKNQDIDSISYSCNWCQFYE